MHLITLDRLEPTLAKVILGRCRQKIELAKTTCGQPVEQLPHDATAEAVAAIVGQHCDRSNQGRNRVRLRTAAADHFFAFARDEKRAPVLVHAGEPRPEIRRRLANAEVEYALLVDEHERPLGWIGPNQLGDDGPLPEGLAAPGAPLLEPESTLRDALSAMLGSSVQLGAVVDERERVLGVISVDQISEILRRPTTRRVTADAS